MISADDNNSNDSIYRLQSKAASSRRSSRGESRTPGGASQAASADTRMRSKTSWQAELLAVDFRHAFWPWMAYLGALFMLHYGAAKWEHETHPLYVWNSWAVALAGLAAPAVAVRIFCTDFDHGTAARLLSTPVLRGAIWAWRLGLITALLPLPALITYVLVPKMSWLYLIGEGVGEKPYIVSIMYLCGCAWSFGPVISLLLQRSILAWTTVVISPLLVAIIGGIVFSFVGIDALSPALFPYMPNDILITAGVLGIVMQFVAAFFWRHLEVRS